MHGTAQIIWRESHCILLGWQPRLWFQPSRLHFAFLCLLWCQWQPRLCQVAAAAQLQQCQASPRTSLCILPSRLHRSSVHCSSSGDARDGSGGGGGVPGVLPTCCWPHFALAQVTFPLALVFSCSSLLDLFPAHVRCGFCSFLSMILASASPHQYAALTGAY